MTMQSTKIPMIRGVTKYQRRQLEFARSEQGITYKDYFEQGGFFDVDFGSGSQTSKRGWKLGVVYRCIAVIAETIGSLKMHLYEYTGTSFKEANGILEEVYQTEPNENQTWFEFFSTLIALCINEGNAYVRIFRNMFGDPIAYHLMKAGVCDVFEEEMLDGRIKITYFVNGTAVDSDDIIHIKCLGSDGVKGESILGLARRAIDAGSEQQELSYALNKNGLNLQGVLETPSSLSDSAYARMKESMERFKGAKNANGTIILEEGLKYSQMNIKPSDAEFVANRDFTVEDICRFFGVPPHKVMSLKRSTNNNIEHQDLEFYKATVLGWLTRIEQGFDKKALRRSQRVGNVRKRHKFDVKDLLRGDTKARTDYYNSLFAKGAIQPDEIRESEGLNPIGSPATRATYMQLAMSDIEKLDENRKSQNPSGSSDLKSEPNDKDEQENKEDDEKD